MSLTEICGIYKIEKVKISETLRLIEKTEKFSRIPINIVDYICRIIYKLRIKNKKILSFSIEDNLIPFLQINKIKLRTNQLLKICKTYNILKQSSLMNWACAVVKFSCRIETLKVPSKEFEITFSESSKLIMKRVRELENLLLKLSGQILGNLNLNNKLRPSYIWILDNTELLKIEKLISTPNLNNIFPKQKKKVNKIKDNTF